MGAYKGKRECQTENEKDDSARTKPRELGTLCTGQKDSLKDSVLSKEYPRQMSIIYNREQGNKAMKTSKKPQTAIDKSTDLVYNTDMLKTIRKNEMIEKLEAAFIIVSCLAAIAACAIGGAFWLISDIM